ncbi:MAG: pilus assembly protein TadG-related protein [Candidatus Acidiferrales bacterium]
MTIQCTNIPRHPAKLLIKRNPETGQALAAVALGLVALIGIVGLAIDMGYMRYEKRRLQSAADSAAIAGASELQFASGNYATAAKNDSKANGFEDGVNGVSVSPSNPPADAPFSGVSNPGKYVEVQVQQVAPTFFMRIFGVNSVNLTASAVAELGSARGCVYSLGPGSGIAGGITLGGNLTAPGCGVVDNSVLDLGGGCVNAASIGVVLNLLGGCATPAPIVGIAPSADPLAYLVAPAVGACLPDPNISQPAAAPPVVIPAPPLGSAYCSITVRATNAAQVQFTPGVYVLARAPGLQLQGTGDVTGGGVMFYSTADAPIQITTTGTVTLSAPTAAVAGVPGGVLFFQDRADVQLAQIRNGILFLTGALYFPGTQLTLGGNNATPYLILVAQALQLQGNVTIGTDYSSLTDGSPIKAAYLVQ